MCNVWVHIKTNIYILYWLIFLARPYIKLGAFVQRAPKAFKWYTKVCPQKHIHTFHFCSAFYLLISKCCKNNTESSLTSSLWSWKNINNIPTSQVDKLKQGQILESFSDFSKVTCRISSPCALTKISSCISYLPLPSIRPLSLHLIRCSTVSHCFKI